MATQHKIVDWVGSLRNLPKQARCEIGHVLDHVQRGDYHQRIKPLKGMSGIYEIRADDSGDTYRAVYVINLGDKIYVLHVSRKNLNEVMRFPKKI